jgi:ParB family chromosome partitioning protein
MGKLDELKRAGLNNAFESMGAFSTSPSQGVAPPPLPSGLLHGTTPARLEGVVRAKDVCSIPIEKIDRDPSQPREEFDEESLSRLSESLKARGQLQPVRVRWDDSRGVYTLIVGERRWRAARMAGLATLSCVVMEGSIEPGELLAIQLVENAVREDLRPIEQARAYQRLIEAKNWSARQLARELAIDHTGVARALALLELPSPVQERVEQGGLSPSTAYEIAKIDDPTTQTELAARVVAEGMTRSETAAAVKRASKPAGSKGRGGTAKGKAHKVTSRVFRSATGPRLTIEWRKGLDDDLIRAALVDILGQLDAARTADDQAAA